MNVELIVFWWCGAAFTLGYMPVKAWRRLLLALACLVVWPLALGCILRDEADERKRTQ